MANVIQHNEIKLYEELCIQSTSVSIKINSIPVTIFAVYCSSCHNIRQEDLQIFFNILSHSFIAGGDFNSKYFLRGCYSNNPSRKSLHSVTTNKHFSFISPSSLTRRPAHTNIDPGIIYFFCTKATKPNKYTRREHFWPLEWSFANNTVCWWCSSKYLWTIPYKWTYQLGAIQNRNININLKIPLKTQEDIG